eukprot:384185_1
MAIDVEDVIIPLIVIFISLIICCCLPCICGICCSINCSRNAISITRNKNLFNKVIIITGANSGIGKETVRSLAETDATIIMACRNIGTAEIIRNEIVERSNNNNILVMKLDLSSIHSINNFVNKFKNEYNRLDILICNAGIWSNKNNLKSNDGIELTFAVNHLGHFHLALSLKDLMERNIDNEYSRLILTSSIMHRAFTTIDCCNKTLIKLNEFDINKINNGYNESTEAYSFSKLCNIMFVKEWSKRYKFKENSNIIAVCVHPGFGLTNLFHTNMDTNKNNCCIKCLYNCLINGVLDTAQQLAYTQCYCAVTDINNLRPGCYYRSNRRRSVVNVADNHEYCQILWDKSLELIENGMLTT